ncbi:hypothetical protein [Actinoplanes sp. NPDC051411]|uniref:phosphorylase family protein n=1 Tax=Actinoplanes sp. NPDC051411 TaxID=3155522 RepID=UPI0034324C3F
MRSSPAVVLAGIGVALAPDLQPGDIVVADRVRADALTEGPVPATRLLPGAPMLAGALIRRGLRVHLGAVISTDRIADPNARERLAMAGVLAADRESAWVLSGRIAGRAACVRVVASSSSAGSSWRGGIAGLRAALRALPTVADGIVEWCEAGDRLCGAPTTSRPR